PDMCCYAEDAGRSPETIEIALNGLWFRMDETFENEDGQRMPFTGSDASGLDELVIGYESDDLQVSLDRLDAFADRIMPKICSSENNDCETTRFR
ncbi:MAG: hypothetical protein VXX79_07675, partial [Pseudomonadota bacterium]|nr:hypothetical protein [Pseudomonadota bacterium]